MYYILEYILPHIYMYNTIDSRKYIIKFSIHTYTLYIHIHTRIIHYTVVWQIPYKMNQISIFYSMLIYYININIQHITHYKVYIL